MKNQAPTRPFIDCSQRPAAVGSSAASAAVVQPSAATMTIARNALELIPNSRKQEPAAHPMANVGGDFPPTAAPPVPGYDWSNTVTLQHAEASLARNALELI